MTVGTRFALFPRDATAVGLDKAFQDELGAFLLAVGKRFREAGSDVRLGELQLAKALVDACWAPAPTFGTGTGEIASERGVVDVAALAQVCEGLLDLVGIVAGAGHLLRELAFAVSAARQPGEREVSRFRLGAIGSRFVS
jgi:hypothetical protein